MSIWWTVTDLKLYRYNIPYILLGRGMAPSRSLMAVSDFTFCKVDTMGLLDPSCCSFVRLVREEQTVFCLLHVLLFVIRLWSFLVTVGLKKA